MDVSSIPSELTVENWLHLMEQVNVCFYDSEKGDKPRFTNPNTDIKMYDVREEEDMREFEKILNENGKDFVKEEAKEEPIEEVNNVESVPEPIDLGEDVILGTGGAITPGTNETGFELIDDTE